MKWFVWLSFIILLTLVDNLTLNVNCKVISSLENDELSVNHNGLDKSAKESLASSSQLMPFFYVGDIDKSSTSKPLITKIIPKSDRKQIKTKKDDKDSSSRLSSSSSPQSTTPRPQLINRIKSTKIPILIPLSSPLSANRRVFNDNELASNLNDDEDDDEDKALPPSYKLLWYLPPRSSSSSSPSPSPSPLSRSSFSSEYTPLFKYNPMVGNPPTGYLKPNYYHSEYHLPFNSHYSIYQPSSLNFPIYPDFPSPTSNSIDENINIHDDYLDEDNQHYQLYGKSFYSPPRPPPPPSLPLPPSRSFTSTLYSPHHHPPPPMFPSREQSKHFTMSNWIENGLSDGPSVHRRYQRPKPSGFRSKDILQDPDIEKLLSTFDLEKSFDSKKDKTYRPRKSYDDNLTMNGKYSENDNLNYQIDSRGWDGFMNNGIFGRSNSGHYGGRTDFKPYYDYYKNLQVSPYTVKQSAKSIQTR